jgi:GTP-binding protein HflX
MIRRKISHLKRSLERVARHREVIRGGRRPIPTAALVGYTNAGKSSLLRALTGAEVFIEDRLFATLDTQTREMHIGDGRRIRLIDTVGFIRKLPHHLVASFRATLEEAARAEIVVHVIDASHLDWEGQADIVDDALHGLERDGQHTLHVMNKMDLVERPDAVRARAAALYEHVACVSALRNDVAEVVGQLGALAPAQARRA